MKCEVWNCHNETDNYLCQMHTEMAQRQDVGFIICDNCKAIVDICEIAKARILPQEIVLDMSGRYITVKYCKYCKEEL